MAKLKRACIRYGPKCSDGGVAVPGTSRCRAHTNSNWGRSKHPYSSVYKSQQWVELRKRVLREEPTCAVEGCTERSTSVDHIVSLGNGGDPYDRSNLRGYVLPAPQEAIEPAGGRGSKARATEQTMNPSHRAVTGKTPVGAGLCPNHPRPAGASVGNDWLP